MADGGYFKSRMAAKDSAQQAERDERRAEAQKVGLQLLQSLPWDMATVLVMCSLHVWLVLLDGLLGGADAEPEGLGARLGGVKGRSSGGPVALRRAAFLRVRRGPRPAAGPQLGPCKSRRHERA